MRKIFIVCFLMVIWGPVFSEQRIIDSLNNVLRQTKDDTNQVLILNQLCVEYRGDNPGKSLQYGDMGLELSKKLKWDKGVANSYNCIGTSYMTMADPKNGQEYYEKALSIYRKLNDRKDEGITLCNIANAYGGKGEYEKGLEYNFEALKIDREVNNKVAEAKALFRIGQMYHGLSNYPLALGYFFQSLKIVKSIHVKYMAYGPLNGIGNTYFEIKEYSKAIIYFQQALDAAIEDKEPLMTKAVPISNIGSVYIATGRYKEALKIEDSCLEIYKKAKNKYLISTTIESIGQVNFLTHEYKKAIDYLQQAIQLYKEMDRKDLECSCVLDIARMYDSLADVHMAKIYATEALQLASASKTWNIQRDAYQFFSEYYDKTMQPDKAYKAYKNYISLRDTIMNKEKEKDIVRKEMQYNFDIKELKAKAEKDSIIAFNTQNFQKERLQRNAFLGGGLLFGLLSISLFTGYRINKRKNKTLSKQKEEIEQQNSEKELLLRELHHRVKNNLQIVSGLLSMQADRVKDEAAATAFREGQNCVEAMSIIHNRLYLRENITTIEIKEYMENLLNHIRETYGYDDDRLVSNMEVQNLEVDIDIAIPLGLIINELLSNCFKHAFKGKDEPRLDLLIHKLPGNLLYVRIADNGPGAQADILERTSSSFGIKMITSLTKQLHGAIQLMNESGCCFELKIPIEKHKA